MLPDNYRKLRYIENATVGSYINTGLLASLDMEVLLDGYVIEGNTALFGARSSVRSTDSFVLQSLGSGPYRLGINTVQVQAPTDYQKGTRYFFDFSNDVFSIDGKVITKANAPGLTAIHPIFLLGALNDGGQPSSFGKARLYSMQVYRGDDLIANYMPCLSPNDEYGLFDHVTGVFLSATGTGDLTGEIEPYRELVLTGLPKKLHYQKGEPFDSTGLSAAIVYESGYRNTVTDFQVTGFDSSLLGTQVITVSYGGRVATFSVTINDIPAPPMLIPLKQMKEYLRVDYPDDDELITGLIYSAQELCAHIVRCSIDEYLLMESENTRTAVLYAVSYLYEHREDADNHVLTLSLRSLLFGLRKEAF